jgi:hypothetical protein
MKKIMYAALLFLISCSPKKELIGTWQVKNYSPCERMYAFLHGAHLSGFRELVLNPDSTFSFEGNCTMACGRWRVWNDTLAMYPDTSWFKGPSIIKQPYQFVKGHYLDFIIKSRKLVKLKNGESAATGEPEIIYEVLK